MRLILFILIFSTSFQLYSQSVEIKGVVVNESNGEPLPYAHLYAPNNFGTITNDSGQFLIRIDSNAINDTMFVQSLAYEKRKIAIAELLTQPNSVLKLKKKSYLLNQVEITPKEAEIIALGPDVCKKGQKGVFNIPYSWQTGVVIDIPFQAKLKNVKCRLSKLGSSKFKSLFRVRIYEYDTLTKLPTKELTRNSIITHLKKRRGWVSVDVENESIYVNNEQIFVVIETVQEGKITRSYKVDNPEGKTTINDLDMKLAYCWEENTKVKFQAYVKDYINDTWVDLLANKDYKMYPLITIEVLK